MEEYDRNKIISKYSYNFIIEHHKNKYLENIEIILENYSNKKIMITLYQFREDSISKYSNIFSVDYFINQSAIIKCILLMSKNVDKKIEKILNIIKSQLNYDKNNNYNNITYNDKKICFIIKTNKNIKGDNNESINLIFYITLINLQKEKIILDLKKDKIYNFSNNNIPNLIYELIEQNSNMIQDISKIEKESMPLILQRNEMRDVIKKCDAYYGQSIKMKMDFMDQGIDTDIFKSINDFIFIKENIAKRLNKKIKEIKLIYKASSNGDNINSFHDSCLFVENPQNLLILILTNKKKCFGGFTHSGFEINKYKYDPFAFLFSLDNKEIYPISSKYEKMAINCYEDNFPIIFGSDIYLADCFFSNENNIAQEGYYDYNKSKIKGDYKLNRGKFFLVNELEVYQFDFFE